MTIPHLCTCDDGAVVVCLCDNTKDHDESGFTVNEGVHVDDEAFNDAEAERLYYGEDDL